MNFASDNATGASPQVLAALAAANEGSAMPYGADPWTARAEAALSQVFERDCAVFLVATGTAANALALASLTPPWGAIFCHEEAHVIDDECGAPEFFSAGAKLVGLAGARGKIVPEAFSAALAAYPRGLVKQVQPAALTLTQATESGTLYAPAEIAALSRIAHAAGVGVHMDGARFANALVALGCTPADMTWKAGVDVLSFGATKNGALCCEAVVFFDRARAADFAYRRKRAGHTLSKGRFLGAQMAACLDGGHWLDLAARANGAARRLAEGLSSIPGVRLPWGCEANEVFAILPRRAETALQAAGARYYVWSARGLPAADRPGADEAFLRLVASFRTEAAEVDLLIATVAAAAGESSDVSRSP
jgi:threonine aldolase